MDASVSFPNNFSVSSSSGSFSTGSSTFVDVTNLTVTITTRGRPVLLFLISDGPSVGYTENTSTNTGELRFLKDGSQICDTFIQNAKGSNSYFYADLPTAGSHTYKIQAKTTGGTMYFYSTQLLAIEL
jgi:hypothetical protein